MWTARRESYEPERSITSAYHKNWIDTVQWHLEDIIQDLRRSTPYRATSNGASTSPIRSAEAEAYLHRPTNTGKLCTTAQRPNEISAAIDHIDSMLTDYHMACRCSVLITRRPLRAACWQRQGYAAGGFSKAIEELIEDIEAGRKYMKTYKQMKCIMIR